LVKGIIEVKSSFSISQLNDEFIKKIDTIISLFNEIDHNEFFSGLFVFGRANMVIDESNIENFKNPLKRLCNKINHIAWGKDNLIKFWQDKNVFSVYKLNNLGYSYFISNLIVTISKYVPDQIWIRFPIREGKNKFKIGDINCNEIRSI